MLQGYVGVFLETSALCFFGPPGKAEGFCEAVLGRHRSLMSKTRLAWDSEGNLIGRWPMIGSGVIKTHTTPTGTKNATFCPSKKRIDKFLRIQFFFKRVKFSMQRTVFFFCDARDHAVRNGNLQKLNS